MTRPWRIAAKIAISLAALWLAFRVGTSSLGIANLTRPNFLWLLLVLALHLAILAGLTLRWWLLTRLIRETPGLPGYMAFGRLVWGGHGLGQIAFGPLSSDAVRIAGLRLLQMPLGEALRSVILDRMLGLAGLFLVGFGAFALLVPGHQIGLLALAALGLCAAMLIGMAVAARASNAARQMLRDALVLVRSPLGVPLMALSIATHAMNIATFYCIARAFGMVPPILATVVSVAAGLLGAAAPISVGGWGIRELTVSQAYALQNVIFDGAATVSVMFGLAHIAIGIPGLILLASNSVLFRPDAARGRID